uniref:Uncharacterized protein n=1 Tax=Caenorhabditis japonica TaxID=281687 RepID=A0A2Q4SYN6_CAEJA
MHTSRLWSHTTWTLSLSRPDSNLSRLIEARESALDEAIKGPKTLIREATHVYGTYLLLAPFCLSLSP